VVADQRVNCAATLRRLALDVEDEIEDIAFVIGAPYQIAQLDDRQRSADPVVPGVRGAGRLKGAAQSLDVGVDVANGDYARRRGRLRRTETARQHQRQQKDERSTTVWVQNGTLEVTA
jgi:hypothetical protein